MVKDLSHVKEKVYANLPSLLAFPLQYHSYKLLIN